MKKFFLTLSMAAVSLFVFATPPKKNNKKPIYPYSANQTLQQLYGDVESLKWSVAKDDLHRADYLIDGENFSTFFERDGKFVATTHQISFDQLPALLRKPLKVKFQGKDFNKIVHYESNEASYYFVEVVEEEGNITIFRVTSDGSISRF